MATMKRNTAAEQVDSMVEAYGAAPTKSDARAAWVAYDCACGSGASTARVAMLHAVAKRVTAMAAQNAR